MIGFFPEPYPDELLYSLCARYNSRTAYRYKARTLKELFGESSATAIISLPCNLLHLIELLPGNHSYTVDHLIDEFTLFPFYSPFLPRERAERIRKYMAGFNNKLIHDTSGIAPSSIRSPKRFRYCPACSLEDKEKFGEQYWHRLHQLPGVEVCPLHQIFLEESNIIISNRTRHYEFLEANEVSEIKEPRPLNTSNFFHQVLIKLATDASWLLHQRSLMLDFSTLHKTYTKILIDRRYANRNGIISSKELTEAFVNYFSFEVLEALQCSFNKDSSSRWLNNIFAGLKGNRASHPLRHLLLVQFLNTSLAELFNSFDDEASHNLPFGNPPWPCLDPTSNHINLPTVHECHIEVSRKTNRIIGRFYCSCGFAYSRIGPDTLKEDQFRFDRLVATSLSWENKLRDLWNNPDVSLRQIGQQLEVSRTTVKYHASYQGLPFPRTGSYNNKETDLNTEITKRHQRLKSEFQKNLSAYRAEWLDIRQRHPNAKRTELRRKYLLTHDWLYRNDPEWLEANQPALYVRTESYRKVNWDERDSELSHKVKAVSISLKELPGRPVRVTLKAIGIALECRHLLQKERDKLPLTNQVLITVVETDEEFVFRRIQWAIGSLLEQKIRPTQNQLLKEAGISSRRIQKMPQLQEVIDSALQIGSAL